MKVIALRPLDFSYRGQMFVAAAGSAMDMPADLAERMRAERLVDFAEPPAPAPASLPAAAVIGETRPFAPAEITVPPAAEPDPTPARRGKRRG